MPTCSVQVHPDVVDLGDYARGVGVPLRVAVTLANDSPVAMELRIAADTALLRAFSSVSFGVGTVAGSSGDVSSSDCGSVGAAADASGGEGCECPGDRNTLLTDLRALGAVQAQASAELQEPQREQTSAVENRNLVLDLSAGSAMTTSSSPEGQTGNEFAVRLAAGERAVLSVVLVPVASDSVGGAAVVMDAETTADNLRQPWHHSRQGADSEQLQYSLQLVQGLVRIVGCACPDDTDDIGVPAADVVARETDRPATGAQVTAAELLVRGRSCVSYVYPDQREVHFGACAEGKKYVRDFSVWNASEIATHFFVNPSWQDLDGLIEFMEYDTGDRIEHSRILLAPHGQCRIRVLLHAKSSALLSLQDALWFSIENARDARNVTYVHILLLFRSEANDGGIAVSSGTSLNFGDCYAWEPVYRDVVLRNKLQELVAISLSSTAKEEVTFELIYPNSSKDTERSQSSESPSEGRPAMVSGQGSGAHDFDDLPPEEIEALSANDPTSDRSGLSIGSVAPVASADANDVRSEFRTRADGRVSRRQSVDDIGAGVRGSNRSARSLDMGSRRNNFMTTEQLEFHPGQSRHLRIWYTPCVSSATDNALDYSIGRLSNRSFHLLLRQQSRETRFVSAEARVCESVVTLSTKDLHLGECSVLQVYSAVVTLFNLSDLPSHVKVLCESKALTPASREFAIEPRQSFDLAFTFIPRKPNPDYVKPIMFVNSCNRRHPDCSLMVRAKNLDERRISVHAVFYKILDPAPTNEINFGRTCANYPAIRAFRVQNMTDRPLLLGFEREESVATFVPRWNVKELENDVTPQKGSASGGQRCRIQNEGRDGNLAVDDGAPPLAKAASGSKPQRLRGRDLHVSETRIDRSGSSGPEDLKENGISRNLTSLLDTDVISRLVSESSQSNLASSEEKRLESSHCLEFASLADYIREIPVVDELAREMSSPPRPSHFSRGAHSSGTSSGGARGGVCSLRSSANHEYLEELIREWTEVDFRPLSLEAKVFSSIEEETQCAEGQLRPGQVLYDATMSGALVRTAHIALSSGEESVICVSVTPNNEDVDRRAIDRSLRIKLLSFDKERLQRHLKHFAWRGATFADVSFDDPPARELVLSVHVRKSPVRISPMQSLNFGAMTAGSQKQRSFSIDNTASSACLVFSLRKSRSVASGDIRLGNGYGSGRLGVVRPFSSAVIPFMFRPSLPGVFCETIEVVHEMDPKVSQSLTIKSIVQKRSNFHLDVHTPLDFGVIDCGIESCHILKMELRNDSDKRRMFSVAVVDRSRSSAAVPLPKVLILLRPPETNNLAANATAASSSIAHELSEKEEKLKSYTLKGKAAKAGVLRQEVEKLKALLADELAAIERSKLGMPKGESEWWIHKKSRESEESITVFEDEASFYVTEYDTQAIEVRLLAPRSRHMRIGSRGGSFDRHFIGGSARDSDAGFYGEIGDFQVEGCDPGIAGYFKFTLGVYESKNRERTHPLNCFAQIAQTMHRSESTSSTSELIIPTDEEFEVPGRVSRESSLHDVDYQNHHDCDADGTVHGLHSIPLVDFGEVFAGVTVRRPIQIRNMSDELTEYCAVFQSASTSDGKESEDSGSLRSACRIHVTGLDVPIPPGGQVTFFVELTPLTVGVHSRKLILRSKEPVDQFEDCFEGPPAEHRVYLTASCRGGEIVQLDLDDGSSKTKRAVPTMRGMSYDAAEFTLDLGKEAFDPSTRFSIVRRLKAVSLVDVDVSLTIGSNLSQQVTCFGDESLCAPAVNLRLFARSSRLIWVAVSPRLRPHEYREGTVRNIIGGLLLESVTDDLQKISETTVRFVATVGSTPIFVDPSCLDLGSVRFLSQTVQASLCGSFSLMNRSRILPAKYDLMASTPSIIFAGETSGKLECLDAHDASGSIVRSVGTLVRFKLICDTPGLLREWVDVLNIRSPSLSVQVEVQAFADPGDVEWKIEHNRSREEAAVAHVYRDGQSWLMGACDPFRWSLNVADGRLPEQVMFIPCSKDDLSVSLTEILGDRESIRMSSDSSTPGVDGRGLPFLACGPSFSLGGSESRVRTLFVYPQPPASITPHQDEILRSGRLLVVDSTVLIRRELPQSECTNVSALLRSVVQRCPIQISYCESRLDFLGLDSESDGGDAMDPDHVSRLMRNTIRGKLCTSNVGTIGHCSGWRDETVTSRVFNPTEAPVEVQIERSSPGLRLEHVTAISGSLHALQQDCRRFVLHAKSTAELDVRISSREVFSAGADGRDLDLNCEISIVNRMNPRSCLAWKVVGSLVSSRLQFDGFEGARGFDGRLGRAAITKLNTASQEFPSLLVPDVAIPGLLPSSATFLVRNRSGARIAVKSSFERTTNAAGPNDTDVLSDLFEIHVSDSVLGVELSDITLGPEENISIRVSVGYVGAGDELVRCDRAFLSFDSVRIFLGDLRFECVVGGAIEPAESVALYVNAVRGSALVFQPPEICFKGLMARQDAESFFDPSSQSTISAPSQSIRIRNLWKRTKARYIARVSGLPSGLSLELDPVSDSIPPCSNIDMKLTIAMKVGCRVALYSNATLIVFDRTTDQLKECSRGTETSAAILLHIYGGDSTAEADNSRSLNRNALNPSNCLIPSIPVGEVMPHVASREHTSNDGLHPLSHLTGRVAVEDSRENLHVPGSRANVVEHCLEAEEAESAAEELRKASSSDPVQHSSAEENAGLSGVLRIPDENDVNRSTSKLRLKGCAQALDDLNRYELNCGQFSVTSEPYVRRIIVENCSARNLEYKVVRIRPWSSSVGHNEPYSLVEEESWLMVNRSGGILGPAGQPGDSQSLILTLARDRVDIFSTYLIIESSDEQEVKVLRLSLEVVADGSAPGTAESYFSVLCDGRGADSHIIDYSIVMFDQVYRHRSFVVSNESGVTLEFVLSDDLPDNAKSEFTFSLSNTLLRKTTRLTIPPKEKRRVFLFYRPMLEAIDPANVADEIVRVFYVRVNCRLVRDYEVNVKIMSRCRHPALVISSSDFVFDCAALVEAAVSDQPSASAISSQPCLSGPLSFRHPSILASLADSNASETSTPRSSSPLRQGSSSSPREIYDETETDLVSGVSPAFGTLTVRSKVPDADVVFVIRNNSRFFTVDETDEIVIRSHVDARSRVIVIRPNLALIRERAHVLHKERYVEEHMTIYNRVFPREFFWIRIRLAIGGAASEFSAVTHKRGFQFAALEGIVSQFLRQFGVFWEQFRRPNFVLNAAALEKRLGTVDGLKLIQRESNVTYTQEVEEESNLAAWATFVASASSRPGYSQLLLEMHYATDELVYYMLKSGSQSGLQLASMLYSYVFKHDVFATFLQPEGRHLVVPEMLIGWIGQLGHFLSFFPDKADLFRGLCELENRFRKRIAPPPS